MSFDHLQNTIGTRGICRVWNQRRSAIARGHKASFIHGILPFAVLTLCQTRGKHLQPIATYRQAVEVEAVGTLCIVGIEDGSGTTSIAHNDGVVHADNRLPAHIYRRKTGFSGWRPLVVSKAKVGGTIVNCRGDEHKHVGIGCHGLGQCGVAVLRLIVDDKLAKPTVVFIFRLVTRSEKGEKGDEEDEEFVVHC